MNGPEQEEGRMAIIRVFGVVGAVFLLSPSLGYSADVVQEGLSGLPGVLLFVGDIIPNAEHDGLSKTSIYTDVEHQLRVAGIRILTHEEWSELPGRPTLSIDVVTQKARGISLYIFGVEVSLREQVTALRSGRPLTASTWESDVIGNVSEANFAESVRDNIRGEVDKFINAFRAANPKR
jgi:hypothetical protein